MFPPPLHKVRMITDEKAEYGLTYTNNSYVFDRHVALWMKERIFSSLEGSKEGSRRICIFKSCHASTHDSVLKTSLLTKEFRQMPSSRLGPRSPFQSPTPSLFGEPKYRLFKSAEMIFIRLLTDNLKFDHQRLTRFLLGWMSK